MGHSHEASFLAQSYADSVSLALPSVREGLKALSVLADHAHIKLNRSPLPSQRLIDPAHLEKYMVHFQSRVLPSVARHDFHGDPFFVGEDFECYQDSVCEWTETIPFLKQLYAAFPDVVRSLDTVDVIMRNEKVWKEQTKQHFSPAAIELFLDHIHETYVSKNTVLAPYYGP